MRQLTRRRVLRSGGALSLSVGLAGCGGDDAETTTADDSPIPGVENGEIVDSHALATAHSNRLADRRGTLYKSATTLDTETGDTIASSVTTTRVDGEQIYAVTAGRSANLSGDETRREYYFDDEIGLLRSRSDEEWRTQEIEPGTGGVTRGDLIGRTTIEIVDVTKIGMEPLGDTEVHRFGTTGRQIADGEYRRFRIQALISDRGLVHDFQQTVDYPEEGTRETREWFLDDLGATVVAEPDWVVEAKE